MRPAPHRPRSPRLPRRPTPRVVAARGLHRLGVAVVCGLIVATSVSETTHAQRVRLPADFALPAEGPPPSAARGLAPDDLPLTDEGPAERAEEAAPDALVPAAPPPPFATVASPRHRDPRGRGRPPVIDPPRLRFLLATEFEPFNALDARGRPGGFHVELARGLCDALDLLDRCQVQAMPWSALRGALLRGEGEAIIAGLAVTSENREDMSFTAPYLRFPARFAVRRGEAFDPAAAARVGVARGTAHAAMLAALFPTLEAVPLADDTAVRAALRAGEVDAAFGDGARLSAWLAGGGAGGDGAADPSANAPGQSGNEGGEGGGTCCELAGGPYFSEHFLGRGLSIAARDPEIAGALDWALAEMEATGQLEEAYLAAFPVGFY